MEFICKPEPLKLGTVKQTLYAQWAGKQQKSQLEVQRERLSKILKKIQANETEQMASKLPVQHHDSFYRYTSQWKQSIERKIEAQRCEKKKAEEEEGEKGRKCETKILRSVSLNYEGPIMAWDRHFEKYVRKKLEHAQIYDFKPQICEKSRKITQQSQVGEPVEDRLIKYGQYVQERRLAQVQGDAQCSKTKLTEAQLEEKFNSLYKDAERLNRKKAEESSKIGAPFQPKINRMDPNLEERVQKIRKPLYYIPSQPEKSPKIVRAGKNLSESFQDFLKRNQALLDSRSTHIKKGKEEQEKEARILPYSFKPTLSSNSLKILQTKATLQSNFAQKQYSQQLNYLVPRLDSPRSFIDKSSSLHIVIEEREHDDISKLNEPNLQHQLCFDDSIELAQKTSEAHQQSSHQDLSCEEQLTMMEAKIKQMMQQKLGSAS